MVQRSIHLRTLQTLLAEFPVVALVGARQVGKTTLANALADIWNGPTHRFDLEDPRVAARLANPMLALEGLTGLVVVDEIQLRPDLFPALRVLADRPALATRFLILGSAAPELLQRSAESLAGRIAYHELSGFDCAEIEGSDDAALIQRLWHRGGFPKSFLAASDAASLRWRREFARTYLERDIPALGLRLAPATLRRFWGMLAHYHGQIWNGSEFARAFGVTERTVRHYLDILAATFMVRILAPWHENLGKRQVKAPKIYLSDSGLLHNLLDIASPAALANHPKVGASWEGFALHQVVAHLGVDWNACHYWKLHTGAELDLLVQQDGHRIGFEFKLNDAPRLTPSMRSAMEHLGLQRLYAIHAGQDRFPLAEGIEALPLVQLSELEAMP